MAYLNSVSIDTAVQEHCPLDLSCDHQTTSDFFQPRPIYYRRMFMGESISWSAINNCIASPMPQPTFGRIRENIRLFFVPDYQVFKHASEFYEDVIGSGSYSGSVAHSAIPVKAPFLSNRDLWTFFKSGVIVGYGALTTAGSATSFDKKDESNNYYVFTAIGRKCYKVLRSLGLDFNPNANDQHEVNVLLLLSYGKIFYDWYSNSQYLDDANLLRLNQIFNYADPSQPYKLVLADLPVIFGLFLFACYDSNPYFELAFDNPVSPISTQMTTQTWLDVTSPNATSISYNSDGAPEMFNGSATTPISLGTKYLHQALDVITKYQQRHQLSASIVDRWLLDYGMQSKWDNMNRSVYIGSHSTDIVPGMVYSTADTSNGAVGEYAGRAGGDGASPVFNFTADYPGYLIAISTKLPSAGYVQGIDACNLALRKSDFYQPAYDGMIDVIERRELYMSDDGNFGSDTDYSGKFGFTRKYNHLKSPRSWFTGDYSLHSMVGGRAWNLFRLFDDAYFNNAATNINHGLDFTVGSDYDRYDRIFDYTKDVYDHFNDFYHFDVHSIAPCKPMFELFDTEAFDKNIKLNLGAKVN